MVSLFSSYLNSDINSDIVSNHKWEMVVEQTISKLEFGMVNR